MKKWKLCLEETYNINTAGDNLSTEITNRIAEIKRIESNKTEYMSMNLHESDLIRHAKADGFAEGESAGAQKAKIETAKTALSMNFPLDQICKLSGLSENEIKELKKANLP